MDEWYIVIKCFYEGPKALYRDKSYSSMHSSCQTCYPRSMEILIDRWGERKLNLQLSNQGLAALLLSHCRITMDFNLIWNSVISFSVPLFTVDIRGISTELSFFSSNVRLYLVFSPFFLFAYEKHCEEAVTLQRNLESTAALCRDEDANPPLWEKLCQSKGHYQDVIRILNVWAAEMKGHMRHLFCHQCTALHSSPDTRSFEQAIQVVTPSQRATSLTPRGVHNCILTLWVLEIKITQDRRFHYILQ